MSGFVNKGRLEPLPARPVRAPPPQYYIPWDPSSEWCQLIDTYLRANFGPQNPNPRQDRSNGSHEGSGRPGAVPSSLALVPTQRPSSSTGTGIYIGSAPAPRLNPVFVNGHEQSKTKTKTKALKVKKVKMSKAEPKQKKPKAKKRAGAGEFVPEMYTGSFAAAAAVKEMPNEFTVENPLDLTDVGAEVEIGGARIAALERKRGFEKKYRTALRELSKHPFNPDHHKTQDVLEVENLIEKVMSTDPEEEGNEKQIMVLCSGEGGASKAPNEIQPQQSQNAPNSGPPEPALVLPVPVSPTKQPKSKSKKKKKSSAPKRVRWVVPKKVPAKKLKLVVTEESNEDKNDGVVNEVQPLQLRQDVPSSSNPATAGTHRPEEYTYSTPPSTPVPVSNVVVVDANPNLDGNLENDADKENVPPPPSPADPEKTNENDAAKSESGDPKQEPVPPQPEDDDKDGASIQKPLTRSQARAKSKKVSKLSKGVGKWVPEEIIGGVRVIYKRVCKR